MVKIPRRIVDTAINETIGGLHYKKDKTKTEQVRKMAGITKGQWKRFLMQVRRRRYFDETIISVSHVSHKKLLLMCEHGGSPHLQTLLKIVEVQMEQESR